MARQVPLKLEDGTVIGTATVHDNGSIDAVITDKTSPVAKLFREQLAKGLISGVSFDPQEDAIFPIIRKELENAWKNDLLRLMPPRTS